MACCEVVDKSLDITNDPFLVNIIDSALKRVTTTDTSCLILVK